LHGVHGPIHRVRCPRFRRVERRVQVIGAIVGDFFFRRGAMGIGRLIDNYAKDLRTAELIVAATVSSLFGILIFVLFGKLSNRVLRNWHDSARSGS
jgi:NitT/TauT family transport system permease protein